MAKLVTKIASIFPFEYDVYKEAGADVEFVGHPLIDIVKPEFDRKQALDLPANKAAVGLFASAGQPFNGNTENAADAS